MFSNSYVNNLELSKDIVQEIFIKIWKEQIQFKDLDHAKAFLYTSIRNKSLDYLNSKAYKSKSNLDVESLETLASETYFEKHVLIEETTRIVQKAINTLPYKCKKIIHLSLKGFGNKQISEELSVSINTVKTQKRIAYQKLRPLLKSAYLLIINILFLKF